MPSSACKKKQVFVAFRGIERGKRLGGGFFVARVAAQSFFFNDTATTEIYTLSLHDALPISRQPFGFVQIAPLGRLRLWRGVLRPLGRHSARSEEHTSELQSHHDLVCRL